MCSGLSYLYLYENDKHKHTFNASAFFLRSLCPLSAAFFLPLKICWFIRVGGTSDMFDFTYYTIDWDQWRELIGDVDGDDSQIKPSALNWQKRGPEVLQKDVE